MPTRLSLNRREFTALIAAVPLSLVIGRAARAESARRVIALDWGLAETLVALGHPPLGAAEIGNYDRSVVAPQMPKGVVDVGLRLSPNPELERFLHELNRWGFPLAA